MCTVFNALGSIIYLSVSYCHCLISQYYWQPCPRYWGVRTFSYLVFQMWMNWRNVFLCWLKNSKPWLSSQLPLHCQPWGWSRGWWSSSAISLPWTELFSRRMSKLSGKAAAFLCLPQRRKGKNINRKIPLPSLCKFLLFFKDSFSITKDTSRHMVF